MLKFSANLSMLFTEVPFLERFNQARQFGLTAVEYMEPYAYSPELLRQQLLEHGLTQVLFNLPAGDWAAGDRGMAVNPDRIAEFRTGVEMAAEYALKLGVKQVNCLCGRQVIGCSAADQWRVLIDNIRFAAGLLHKYEVCLLLEPINHYDVPGFIINRPTQAIALIEAAGCENVKLQYDIYHAQREGCDLVKTLNDQFQFINHIQIADNPGRHQPGTGEIDYTNIFKTLSELNYAGYIGLEYVPTPTTAASLSWLQAYNYIRDNG